MDISERSNLDPASGITCVIVHLPLRLSSRDRQCKLHRKSEQCQLNRKAFHNYSNNCWGCRGASIPKPGARLERRTQAAGGTDSLKPKKSFSYHAHGQGNSCRENSRFTRQDLERGFRTAGRNPRTALAGLMRLLLWLSFGDLLRDYPSFDTVLFNILWQYSCHRDGYDVPVIFPPPQTFKAVSYRAATQ